MMGSPTTAADIEEWIAARRARFPTKARIESRKAAAKKQNGDAGKADALEQQAEKLRKQLEQVESSIKRKREQQDEGDDERDVDLAAPSSDEAKSENGRLEVQATRHDAAVLAASQRKADPTRHCKYYSTGGTCGKKGKCRFVHDPSVREAALKEREKNGGRMTLQQRLTLNDKDQEDLTIVQTLKYLQDRGLLENSGSDGAGTAADRVHSQPSQTPIKERLNSLPPIPPKSVPKV